MSTGVVADVKKLKAITALCADELLFDIELVRDSGDRPKIDPNSGKYIYKSKVPKKTASGAIDLYLYARVHADSKKGRPNPLVFSYATGTSCVWAAGADEHLTEVRLYVNE